MVLLAGDWFVVFNNSFYIGFRIKHIPNLAGLFITIKNNDVTICYIQISTSTKKE